MYTKFPAYVMREDGACIPMDERNSDYQAFLDWEAAGGVANDPPQPTVGELILRAVAEIRIQRQPIIEVLDGLQASSLTKGEATRAQVIETAKQGLRDITDTDLSDCMTYEDMRLKVKAAYIALAVALPFDVRRAFSEAIS